MCGITGIISDEAIDGQIIKKMAGVIHHRGPDDFGYYIDDNVALANTRLSIIDLDYGHQPMISDNGVVIVFNGEIYNYIELREQLMAKGVRFNTNSDTEVILKLYERVGESCFEMLNGMFAIAILDKDQLYLARDRSGIKPLYYTIVRDGDSRTLIFGSEIKTILATGFKRELFIPGFHSFLNLRFVPNSETMFKGIFKLKAGTFLIWDKNYVELETYWKPKPNHNIQNLPQAVKLMETLLPKAVERHMIADVEVGSYLSGGLDSSTIVHFASQMSDYPLKTFTLGFGQETDETRKAAKLAEHYGTDHHELIIPDRFMDDARKILWHSEFPKRNLYPYYLAEMASSHVKVVLSGLGADELFCGYTWKYDQIREDNSRPKYVSYTHKISLDQVFTPEQRLEWYGPELEGSETIEQEFKPFFTTSLDPMRSIQLADYQVKMVDDFLHVDDVTSMAHSLESRTPFLDNTLVDLAFSVPVDIHLNGQGKNVIRQTMKGKLPDWSLKIPKHGFTISMTDEYKDRILEYGKNMIPNGHAVQLGLISPEVMNRTDLKESPNIYTIWNLLWFEEWYQMFFVENFKG